MPIYTRGVEPTAFYIGETPVIKKYLGSVLIWDGTRSAVAQAQRATATATVRTATVSASSSASVLVATGNATAFGATATASAQAIATAAAATAAVHAPAVTADAAATVTVTTATAQVHDATGAETFDGIANATAATATALVHDAVPTADATADAIAATATTIVYDAVGGGAAFADATAATATATVLDAAPSASSSADALVATGSASAHNATPSATATADATAATATAEVMSATGNDGVIYTDDFNRASLGTDWVTIGSLAPVIGGSTHVQAGTGGAINATSAYVARYVSAVTGNNHRTFGTLVTPTGTANSALGTGLFVRAATGGDRVEAVFTPTSVTITTKTGGSGGTSTTRATQGSLTIALGAVIELVAAGNVYTAYVDGVSVVSWTDSGGVITIDASHRSVGVTLFSNRNFSSAYTYGWALDDWVGRDG